MKTDNKSNILVILTGLTILGLLFERNQLIITGLIVAVSSLLSNTAEKWIVFVWVKLAHILGWINSRILLSLVFFIILTPLSFLKRLLSSKDSLKLSAPDKSIWMVRNHLYISQDLKAPF